MASDTQAQADIPAQDYQALPKPVARIDPIVKVGPTCMIWGIVIGLGLLVLTMLMWAIAHLGPVITRAAGG